MGLVLMNITKKKVQHKMSTALYAYLKMIILSIKLVHFMEVHRSIASMSGSDHCFCRFHPTLPVLVCGFNRVFLLNAENWSVPFSEWKEKEIKFEGQGLKTITIFEWNVSFDYYYCFFFLKRALIFH